jgi:uncharacterized protein YfkK (UPF0435 family)
MKPKLLMIKRFRNKKTIFNFCVVDAEKTAKYPLNWICNFPKQKDRIKNFDSALKLLNDALINPEYANNAEILAEIKERIKILSPKPKLIHQKRKVNLEVLYT